MKNIEKYSSPMERAEAFRRFCKNGIENGIVRCNRCPLFSNADGLYECVFKWLDLDSEVTK